MADWSKPVLTSTYTNFVNEVKDRDIEAATWFEGASPTNLVTNAKRLNTSTGRIEKWNGTAWVDAVATFTFPALSVAGALTVSGNAALATMTASGSVTLNGGTANGLAYLNASKVLTTGSSLTFDGSQLSIGVATPTAPLHIASASSGGKSIRMNGRSADGASDIQFFDNTGATQYADVGASSTNMFIQTSTNIPIIFYQNGSEQMRLTSTGLGIGTSSPGYKLHVSATASTAGYFTSSGAVTTLDLDNTNANGWGGNIAIRTGGTAAGYFGTIGSLLGNTTQDLAVYANTGNGFRVYTNGNNLRATFDSAGNLGLGVTPSAWTSGSRALQFGAGGLGYGAVSLDTGGATRVLSNAFESSTGVYKYVGNLGASAYVSNFGVHQWLNAASGTAGANISFTQAMTLDASGLLQVGLTANTGGGRVDVLANATSAYVARSTSTTGANGGTSVTSLRTVDSSASYWANAQYDAWQHIFRINGTTEAARIASTGQMSTTDGAGNVKAAYDARAWVNFNGTGTVAIRSSGNVSSITDNGVGDYTVNFTTAMSDANYSVAAITGQTTSTSTNMGVGIRSTSATGSDSSASYLTTSIRLFLRAGGGSANDSDAVSAIVFR